MTWQAKANMAIDLCNLQPYLLFQLMPRNLGFTIFKLIRYLLFSENVNLNVDILYFIVCVCFRLTIALSISLGLLVFELLGLMGGISTFMPSQGLICIL